jgi:hypothetical protein
MFNTIIKVTLNVNNQRKKISIFVRILKMLTIKIYIIWQSIITILKQQLQLT